MSSSVLAMVVEKLTTPGIPSEILQNFALSDGFRYGVSSLSVSTLMWMMEKTAFSLVVLTSLTTGRMAYIFGSVKGHKQRRVHDEARGASSIVHGYYKGIIGSPPFRIFSSFWIFTRTALMNLGYAQMITGLVYAITGEKYLDWGSHPSIRNALLYALGYMRPTRLGRVVAAMRHYPDVFFVYLPAFTILYMAYTAFGLRKKGNVSVTINNIVNVGGKDVSTKTEIKFDWTEKLLLLGEETGLSSFLKTVKDRSRDLRYYGLVGIHRLFTTGGTMYPLALYPPAGYHPKKWRVLALCTAFPVLLGKLLAIGLHTVASFAYLPYYSRKTTLYVPEETNMKYKFRGLTFSPDNGSWFNTIFYLYYWVYGIPPPPPPEDVESDDELEDEDEPINLPSPPPEIDLPEEAMFLDLGPEGLPPGHFDKTPVLVKRKSRFLSRTETTLVDIPVQVPKIEPFGSVSTRATLNDTSLSVSSRRPNIITFDTLASARDVRSAKDAEAVAESLGLSGVATRIYSEMVTRNPEPSSVLGTIMSLDIHHYRAIPWAEIQPGKFQFVGEIDGIKSLGSVPHAHRVPMVPATTNFHFTRWLGTYYPTIKERVDKITRVTPNPQRELVELMKFRKKSTYDKPSREMSKLYPGWSEETFVLEYLFRATDCKNKTFKLTSFENITLDCFKKTWRKFPGYETKVLRRYQNKYDAFDFSKQMAEAVLSLLIKGETLPAHYWASIPVPKVGSRKENANEYRCRSAICPEFYNTILYYHLIHEWCEHLQKTTGVGKFQMFHGTWEKLCKRMETFKTSHLFRTKDIKDHGASISPIHYHYFKLYFKHILIDLPNMSYCEKLIDMLLDDMLNAKIITSELCGGQILQTSSGLKDGVYKTSDFDTLASHINFAHVFWRVLHNPGYPREMMETEYGIITPIDHAMTVPFETHGDNDLRAYPILIEDFFRPVFEDRILKEIGMVLKPDECAESVNITNLEIMGYQPAKVFEGKRMTWVWNRKEENYLKSLAYPECFFDPDDDELTPKQVSYLLGIIQCVYIMSCFNKSIREILIQYSQQVIADQMHDLNNNNQTDPATYDALSLPRKTRLHEKMEEFMFDEKDTSVLMNLGTIPDSDTLFKLITSKELQHPDNLPFISGTEKAYQQEMKDWSRAPESAHLPINLVWEGNIFKVFYPILKPVVSYCWFNLFLLPLSSVMRFLRGLISPQHFSSLCTFLVNILWRPTISIVRFVTTGSLAPSDSQLVTTPPTTVDPDTGQTIIPYTYILRNLSGFLMSQALCVSAEECFKGGDFKRSLFFATIEYLGKLMVLPCPGVAACALPAFFMHLAIHRLPYRVRCGIHFGFNVLAMAGIPLLWARFFGHIGADGVPYLGPAPIP